MAGIDLSKFGHFQAIKNPERNYDHMDRLSGLLNIEISFLDKKFGPKEKESFFSELGLLLSTGVDIKTAFEIISEDIPNKKHKGLLEQINHDIISGMRFYEAIQKHETVFTSYEVQSIKIGEETGKLPVVLKELGTFFQSSIKLRRQIIGVLTYPIVVILMAIVVVFFMLSFVVPIFSDIFTQTGDELPQITQILIHISHKSTFIFYTIALLCGCALLVHKTQRKKLWYRKNTSRFLLQVPLINKLIQKIFLARFCQSMKLLAGSKVVINEALDLVANMIEYFPIEDALKIVKKEVVSEGKSLNESLAQHSIFPKKLVALIKLSEEVNAPEIIFEKLHEQYTAEIEHQQAVIGKLVEPIFIVLLGAFVGFILIAMYLPMFEMSQTTF